MLFREKSCDTELCTYWLEEIKRWPPETARVLRKCSVKFGVTDDLVVVHHPKKKKKLLSFRLVSLTSKNKSLP